MAYYYDAFDYEDGDLNGQGGWAGATEYQVVSSLVGCTPGSGNTRVIVRSPLEIITDFGLTVYGEISFLNRNQAYVKIGTFDAGSSNLRTEIFLFVSSGLPNYFKLYLWDGGNHFFVANVPFTPGETIKYSFSYTLNPSRYTHVIFNGVDYGEQSLSIPIYGILEKIRFICYQHSNPNTIYFNSVGAKQPSKKYNKFPRWQKTKYGLRPFY